MAYPDATIYEFRADGSMPTTWSPIDTVHIPSDF
jgi:predicted ATPase